MAKNAVCKKYKEQLGFSSRTVFLCRGSPLAQDVLKYLAGFDILVHEMFGQSENCGLLSANIPKRYIKLGMFSNKMSIIFGHKSFMLKFVTKFDIFDKTIKIREGGGLSKDDLT